ncbi:MAG: hypothetical protein ACYCSG_05615 [Thermoplasmataceae archaeon]
MSDFTYIINAIAVFGFLIALAISFIPRLGFSYFLSVFVSIALVFLFFISNTYWILPVGMLSLLCAETLYTKNFYIPFMILFALIMVYSILLDLNHMRVMDIAIIVGFGAAFLGHDRFVSYSKVNDAQKGRSVTREVPRDIVQIVGGIVIILGIVYLGMINALFILTISILIYFLVINMVKGKNQYRAAKFINSLERENTQLGVGASWFVIGILALISVVHNLNFIFLVVFAVTFGDSLATIVGTKLKGPKLFFNKKKSYSGFLSMFAATAIIGYYLFGLYGILYAAVAVFSESLSTFPVDDNFAIPVFMTIVYKLVPFALKL